MRPSLRIAMVAPPWFELPPQGYGGAEVVCAALVDALIERGNDVTLIGVGRNGTRSRHVVTYQEPQGERVGELLPELVHAAAVGQILATLDVDVVHDHSMAGPLLARGGQLPTVVTTHNPVTSERGHYYRQLGDSVHLVSISDAQRSTAPDLNWCGTVHNAILADDLTFSDTKDDYVLFLGRAIADKGMHVAIDAALAAGRPIKLAAKCTEPVERAYFESEIRPRLQPGVEWLGEVAGEHKRELLARARCLLFPICWDEPFGMVMIEAMASGTPVIALRRAAVAEVVTHGVTGLICDDPSQLPEAIETIDIDPLQCRKDVTTRFHPDTMAAGYEDAYQVAIARHAAGRPNQSWFDGGSNLPIVLEDFPSS